MANYTNEKTVNYSYEADITPDYAHTMTDVVEPLVRYTFSKKRIDAITKRLNDLQHTVDGQVQVFQSRVEVEPDGKVKYMWVSTTRKASVTITIKSYQTASEPYRLTIYPPTPDFQGKVKNVLGTFAARRGMAEVGVATGMPADMWAKMNKDFIGGKRRKTRKNRV